MNALFGAIDLGASSGRVIAGLVSSGKLTLHELHRFPNGPIEEDGRLVWNFTELFDQILIGLGKLSEFSSQHGTSVQSIGIDCWAVDYGLVSDGKLIRNPSCYRDPRHEKGVELVHAKVPFDRLYQSSGLQFLPFNSIYQLTGQQTAEPELVAEADYLLLMPDLIGFFLTGEYAAERTNASSTGLLNAKTLEWDSAIASSLGIDIDLFPKLSNAGETLGTISPKLVPDLAGTKVVLVGSHDTASAVVGVPAATRGTAFLSSGTWSLLGTELDSPILSRESMEANFTNELGVDNRVRYLKNLSGLWLVTESIRHYNESGMNLELSDLLLEAAEIKPTSTLDVSDPRFIAPGQMPTKIATALNESGQEGFETPAELIAIILHSLAQSYAANLSTLEALTGQSFELLHVIGGGSQNALLNQLTADYTGCKVLAGPVESTAIGNILIQARAAGVLSGTLEDLRKVIINSDFDLQEFSPGSNN